MTGSQPERPARSGLDRLRGRALPKNHDARTISALAANPGCARRALLDAAGVDKQRIAAHIGYAAPFGQSQFAIVRGNAFEAQVKESGGAQLLTLLREHIDLDVSEVGYADLNDIGGNDQRELRHRHTVHVLTGADQPGRTLLDHPLLRLRVGGRHAYLEPDLIALRLDGTIHVIEIKSFAVIDGQADGGKVAAAAIQSAVYVRALRDLMAEAGADPAAVSHRTILVAPRDFSSQPTATSLDVRRQLGVLDRQLSRIASIEDLLARYPGTLTFDLDPDDKGRPRRPAAELAAAIGQVTANYAPECLATCELCFLCRDEAAGTTGALGKPVREDLGGIEYTAAALSLAYGQGEWGPGGMGGGSPAGGKPDAPHAGQLLPTPERAEIAAQLLRAARLREQVLGEQVLGDEVSPP